MDVADISLFVHDTAQRHAPEFEEVDLLAIQAGDTMVGIRQADERNAFIGPIALKHIEGIGSHGEDLSSACYKFRIPVPQARQRRAAVRSHEPAQEIQHDDPVVAVS